VPSPRFERLDPAAREAILSAARAEFAENGFEGSSYNRIIANSALSKSSFYYYFHGKEDLYVTVVMDAIAQFAEAIGEPNEIATVEEFWAECVRLTHRFLEFGMQNLTLLGILNSVTDLKPGQLAGDLMTQITVKDLKWYEHIIQRGQAVGAVRSDRPLDLIIDIYAAVLVARVRWSGKQLLSGEPVDLKEDAEDVVDLFRRMGAPALGTRGHVGEFIALPATSAGQP